MNETARQARQRRQREAQERQAAYDALTLNEKFARAVRRGGPFSREAVTLMGKMVEEKLQQREVQS